MTNKKKRLVLSILGIIGIIIITAGVTYAFFNYAKEGTTENTITTGTITFLYTEVSGVGRGISIDDTYPVSDEVGKAQTGEGKVFDFKVTSNTPNNFSIPYEITARKKKDSTLEESAVKLYLTKVTGEVEEEVLLSNYNSLTQTTKVDSNQYTEKTIYNGKVPADSTNYEQNFRLRMWIDESIDFSPVKDENGNDTYPYNDKEFTVTVNVYANAKVVAEEDIENETKAEISTLIVGDNELTKVENEDYDYETSLPEGTTSTTINVETISPYATVNIERIDSLAYKESNIKRLSTKKTLELNPGDNYFKITVISENKEIENEYIIKILVLYEGYSFLYDYTGTEQTFVVPLAGSYKLEVWGASGGNATGGASNASGGKGGYATGIINLNASDVLYIVIGGKGEDSTSYNFNQVQDGGYNGGGSGDNFSHTHSTGGGGGATHIAITSNRGELKNYVNNKGEILIVAGGGGGGFGHKDAGYANNGGSGGGFSGTGAVPGTQTGGHNGIDPFGQGDINAGHAGGGGGFYGGDVGHNYQSSGGGSGYIGNPLLTNKIMYCYNCEESLDESTKTISTTNVSDIPTSNYAKQGNGYAKITYIGQ